ncbi:DUF4928 family protein [Mesorhizobium caraganae]|uniref:DUF4928 family protein n=1 Tax=Mesorhizobium caraganae TaxID=483206 RepID=UPI00178150C4|nr:DUF4928 family protein [Mesorhizobium caraganae]
MTVIDEALGAFIREKKFRGQGPLSVALVVTQHARAMGLPLQADKLLTEQGGQVLGLGKGAVQAVLKRHGITRTLAREGGRTSRGSINKMREYVAALNNLHASSTVDLDQIESFWIQRVEEFFAGKPFKIRLDASRSLRTVVRDILQQAEERQKAAQGLHYTGAVMQHLVGAKLDCALGPGSFVHNSFSTADSQSGRAGDFLIGDVAVHVTTSPGEAVIERCHDNLNDGFRPVLVTMQRGLTVAEALADNAGLAERIDVFEIEQFIALNLYELGKFAQDGHRVAVSDLVVRYNEIIDEFETDPSLKIEFKQ